MRSYPTSKTLRSKNTNSGRTDIKIKRGCAATPLLIVQKSDYLKIISDTDSQRCGIQILYNIILQSPPTETRYPGN